MPNVVSCLIFLKISNKVDSWCSEKKKNWNTQRVENNACLISWFKVVCKCILALLMSFPVTWLPSLDFFTLQVKVGVFVVVCTLFISLIFMLAVLLVCLWLDKGKPPKMCWLFCIILLKKANFLTILCVLVFCTKLIRLAIYMFNWLGIIVLLDSYASHIPCLVLHTRVAILLCT